MSFVWVVRKSAGVVAQAAALAASLWASSVIALEGGVEPLSVERVANLMAEAPLIPEVALSPEGSSVAYSVTRGSVESNRVTSELWLQPLGSGNSAKITKLAENVGDRAVRFMPGWNPQRTSITYFDPTGSASKTRTLVEYDLASGTRNPITINPAAGSW